MSLTLSKAERRSRVSSAVADFRLRAHHCRRPEQIARIDKNLNGLETPSFQIGRILNGKGKHLNDGVS
nr:hypothetical protein Itr_chr03CG26540 [Ipomoea trifida]